MMLPVLCPVIDRYTLLVARSPRPNATSVYLSGHIDAATTKAAADSSPVRSFELDQVSIASASVAASRPSFLSTATVLERSSNCSDDAKKWARIFWHGGRKCGVYLILGFSEYSAQLLFW